VRLIAATHRDLKAWSEEGRFRPDLYYRLGVFAIHLPPLRERGEDLPLLVRYYVRRFSRELGREVQEVAPEALAHLCSYSWPGNVRELQSVLKQALLQARGTTLLPIFLPALPGEPSGPVTASPSAEDPHLEAFIRRCLTSGEDDLYGETHRQVDRLLLPRVLEETGGNQLQAARRLGIARETLRRRLMELGLYLTRRIEAGQDDPD
jgi:two-component system nitrogen regulation response regulator GlnG